MIEKIDGSIFGRKIYHILGNDVIGLRYAGHAEFHSLGFIHSQFPMTAMADKEPEKNVLWNEVGQVTCVRVQCYVILGVNDIAILPIPLFYGENAFRLLLAKDSPLIGFGML